MVRAVVPGIALRISPSLSAERLGTLPDASRSFVVGGPMKADGYEWIQLAGPGLPPASGCATFPGPELTCPTWFGWAATGTKEGDAWFVLDPSDCPDPSSDPRAFMMLGNVEALHCYGDDEIELTGWIPGPGALRDPPACDIANDVPAAWLFCPDGYSVSVQANDTEAVSIEIYVDPQSNVELAYPGNYPMVSGRLDHPDARGCDAAIPAGWPVIPAWVVLDCRTRFVVTAFGGRGP
jgi:hypothetical protein